MFNKIGKFYDILYIFVIIIMNYINKYNHIPNYIVGTTFTLNSQCNNLIKKP